MRSLRKSYYKANNSGIVAVTQCFNSTYNMWCSRGHFPTIFEPSVGNILVQQMWEIDSGQYVST